MLEILPLIIAGLLTTVSPCVLPVIPFVMASSLSKSKFGPLLLCLGLSITFVTATLLISRSGFLFGLDPNTTRKAAAIILILGGFLFVIPRFQEFFTTLLSRFMPVTQQTSSTKLRAEFTGGLILGLIWTPCSGPSLGVALGFAANAQTFWNALGLLTIFAVSSSLPLLFFAYGARGLLSSIRQNIGIIGILKKLFGLFIILWGFLIFFDFHYQIEAAITEMIPESLLKFLLKF